MIGCPLPPAEVRARAEALDLRVALYQPFRDFEAVPPPLLARNLRRAESKFDVMEELGVDLVLVCSNVDADPIDDDDLAAEQLHQLAERAAARGMRIAYEALACGRQVNTYEHAYNTRPISFAPAVGKQVSQSRRQGWRRSPQPASGTAAAGPCAGTVR